MQWFVDYVEEQGWEAPTVKRETGVNEKTLRNWRNWLKDETREVNISSFNRKRISALRRRAEVGQDEDAARLARLLEEAADLLRRMRGGSP